jgi:hypothetical protein
VVVPETALLAVTLTFGGRVHGYLISDLLAYRISSHIGQVGRQSLYASVMRTVCSVAVATVAA